MRAHGTGTVVPLPNGKFRGRLPGRKGRMLPTRATREEAEDDLSVALARGLRPQAPGTSLATFGRAVLTRRMEDGYSNARREISRWTTHVEQTELGRAAVESFTRGEVISWMRGRLSSRARKGKGHATHRPRTISRSVVVDALRILRAVVREAQLTGLRQDDPTLGVKIPRDRGRTHDPWTWLRPGEVVRLLETVTIATVKRDRGGLGRRTAHVPLVPSEDADAAIVALYTGLREGELWTLHVRDVDLQQGRLTVRYGGRKGAKLQPTKGRKPRALTLLQPAADALHRQLCRLALPDRQNPHGLVFPSSSPTHPGAYRAEGRPPRCWRAWVEAARLTPEHRADPISVTWHSLRHTFATLALAGLLPGAEGEGWRIEKVSAYLGHAGIGVTQRYADVAALL